jgi:3-deoxy-D-arabino-heptulosonate 7-phosphate (DAHP) synthase
VAEAIRVSKPYKLITLDLKQDRTIVDIGGAKIGNGSLAMIAGPCAIETRQQTFAIAEVVKKAAPNFSVAAPLNHAPRPMLSQVWARKA